MTAIDCYELSYSIFLFATASMGAGFCFFKFTWITQKSIASCIANYNSHYHKAIHRHHYYHYYDMQRSINYRVKKWDDPSFEE